MTVKELVLSAKKIYFAGHCTCGCGEKLYDLWADDGCCPECGANLEKVESEG